MSTRWFHTVLKRGRMWRDGDLFPQTVFDRRVALARELLRTRGAQALLAYGDAQQYGHLTYLTHYLPKHSGGLVVLPLAGDPVLLIEAGGREVSWAKSLSWVEDIRPATGGVANPLAGIIGNLGPRSRLAIAGLKELMRTPHFEATAKILGPESDQVDVSADLLALRRTKDASETEAMKKAAGMVMAGLVAASGTIVQGQVENLVAAAADREMRRRGAEDTRFAVASIPGSKLSLPFARSLPGGGSLALRLAGAYQRYWAEAGRTFWVDQIPAVAKELNDIHEKALTTLRSGRTISEVLSSLTGFASPLAKKDIHVAFSLSGIGLDLEEPPYATEIDSTPLQAGTTVVLRTSAQLSDAGPVFLADTVLITGTGATVLTAERGDH